MFSVVFAVNALLTQLRKRRTFPYNATLTANTTELYVLTRVCGQRLTRRVA